MKLDQSSELESQIYSLLHDSLGNEAAHSSEVTILLSDIRGFTALSENYPATDIVSMLNHYFTRMNEIIHKYNGIIDKYMGDSIMVLFGVPDSDPEDVSRAVACAVEMQIAMDTVNQDNADSGLPELFMGIGVNTGSVSAGEVGSELHHEYTVIGDGVNLVSCIKLTVDMRAFDAHAPLLSKSPQHFLSIRTVFLSSLCVSINFIMDASRSFTDVKTPRRSCFSVSNPKNLSTRFNHDELVGIKCK